MSAREERYASIYTGSLAKKPDISNGADEKSHQVFKT